MATIENRITRLEAKRRTPTTLIIHEWESKADALLRYGLVADPPGTLWIVYRFDGDDTPLDERPPA